MINDIFSHPMCQQKLLGIVFSKMYMYTGVSATSLREWANNFQRWKKKC